MSFTCRRGHHSVSDDYCDVCGARNWGSPRAAPAPAAPAPAAAPAAVAAQPEPEPEPVDQLCPTCGAPRDGVDRYCSSCAYDFETGEDLSRAVAAVAPAPSPVPAAPVGFGLVLLLSADHARSGEGGCPPPPADWSDHVFIVDRPSVVIGRDESADVPVPGDPYVSRRHAEIVDLGDQWGLRDLSSTNGTRLNGVALVGSEVKLLKAGDEVDLGCYIRLTIRDRPTGLGA